MLAGPLVSIAHQQFGIWKRYCDWCCDTRIPVSRCPRDCPSIPNVLVRLIFPELLDKTSLIRRRTYILHHGIYETVRLALIHDEAFFLEITQCSWSSFVFLDGEPFHCIARQAGLRGICAAKTSAVGDTRSDHAKCWCLHVGNHGVQHASGSLISCTEFANSLLKAAEPFSHQGPLKVLKESKPAVMHSIAG